MMKKLQIKSWILLLAVLLGGGSAWAEDLTSTLDFTAKCNGSGTADDGAVWTVTSDGTESNFDNTSGIHYGTNNAAVTYLQLSTSDITGTVTQVVVKARDAQAKATVSVTVGGSAFTCTGSANATNSSANYTFTGSGSGEIVVKVDRGSSMKKAIYVKSVVVTYSTGGSNLKCVAPTFSPAAGTYTSAQTVEISSTTDDATIYYTTDGTEPTAESTEYKTAITVSTTTTIKAIATAEGLDNSPVATATYTIVSLDHAGTLDDPYNVADARTAIDANVGLTGVYATGIVSAIVEEYNTNYQNITFDISTDGNEESDQLRAYRCVGTDDADASEIQVGDVVIVSGNLKKYSELYEFEAGCQLVSLGGKPKAPAAPTFSPVAGTYTSAQTVTISAVEGAVIYYTVDGTDPTTTSTQYTEPIAVNTTTTIKAIAVKDELASTVAEAIFTIDLTPSIVFDGIDNPLNVGYEAYYTNVHFVTSNITGDITLVICDAEGNATTYDWFTAEYTGGEYVNISWQANSDTENSRTAYIKLTAGTIETDILAITQAKYVPDYAELPFEFDGGKSSIESTRGLTQEGLGSDYDNSPKLKFDGTGDYLVLKFNERPGTLTFDIKGNSFRDGTFTVQTSEDGETYTKLAEYKNPSNTQNEEFNNLGENVRYIKWIYTKKSSGNVALGNITLAKYEAPSIEPSITLSDIVVNAPAAGADGTITVTYNNITDVSAEVFFCDAEGVATTYEWIDAEINDDNNVDYIIVPNDGEARTAYMKVYALDDEANDVYSELITITQSKYVPATNYTLAYSLVPGKHYVIASGTDGDVYAMGKMKNTNREAVEVTVDNNVIALTGEEGAYEFLIQGPDKNDNYTIYDESDESTGYLYAAGGTGSNHLKVQATKDSNAEWSVSIDSFDGEATIKAKMNGDSDNDRNWMRFNSNNSIFSCYNSSSNQGNIYLFEKVGETAPTEETITISDVKYATYCSKNALDFEGTGVTAYVATMDGNIVKFNPVTKVPAYEGVLLKAEAAGDFTVGTTTSIDTENWSNAFIGVTEATTINETIFVLMKGDWEGGKGVGFYQTTSAFTVGAHTAYLPALAGGTDGARTFIGFDFNDATAINGIAAETMANGEVYNLQGQRVVKAQKGLYIMNGKKVLVK